MIGMAGDEGVEGDRLAAYFTMMEVGSLLQQAVARQLREDGDLSPVQFQILATLADGPAGGQRMTDIADKIVYSRSGFTYQASQLERRGLITRTPARDDERSTVVRLTPEGQAVLDGVMPGHVELVQRLFFDAMPDADLSTLQRVLVPVRDRLRQAPPRSARPRARRR